MNIRQAIEKARDDAEFREEFKMRARIACMERKEGKRTVEYAAFIHYYFADDAKSLACLREPPGDKLCLSFTDDLFQTATTTDRDASDRRCTQRVANFPEVQARKQEKVGAKPSKAKSKTRKARPKAK